MSSALFPMSVKFYSLSYRITLIIRNILSYMNDVATTIWRCNGVSVQIFAVHILLLLPTSVDDYA